MTEEEVRVLILKNVWIKQALFAAHTAEHGSTASFIPLFPPLTELFYYSKESKAFNTITGGSFDVGHDLRFTSGVLSTLHPPLFLSTHKGWKHLEITWVSHFIDG